MQIKFLKSIVENLINKQSVPIIDLLIGKKHVNEFLIAKKLGLTINQTRNILYKLSDYGLVSFIRKKDRRKGWYIYFWTLNIYQSLNLLEQNLKKELENLENQMRDRKERRYYFCKTCSIEVSEEIALLNNFACSECEQIYELSDNKEMIQALEKSIARLKKEINLVSFEKEKEREKIDKKKSSKIKRAEAEKIRVRKKKRLEKIKFKMKAIKKSGKRIKLKKKKINSGKKKFFKKKRKKKI
jgi:transcription factor E